ncbi:MAG: EAL domain-containing protein [Rhizobiaceae bacterium]|nr:EAL domain-containing protein [Rhizobiaceae bacterium]
MRRSLKRMRSAHLLRRFVLPILAIAAAILAAVIVPLAWSKWEADQAAFRRQSALMDVAVDKLRAAIAHDQESATVWDDAVHNVRKGDKNWIDANLGLWMHSYFGHDGGFVLDPKDRPVFSSFQGSLIDNKEFDHLEPAVMPLVSALRFKLRQGVTDELNDRVLSLGVSDLTIFLGRPAVVSIKPIISDSGNIKQVPGEEYLHVAVRLLDGDVLRELADNYMLDGLRFSWTNDSSSKEASIALKTSAGDTLGFLSWRPYRPGSDVVYSMIPTLAAVFLIVMTVLSVLVIAVKRRSLKLVSSEVTIRHLAFHDTLTGLPNRLYFEEVLDREIRRVRNGASSLALLYLDLDRFKQVNDSLGHPAGDELIVQFASRLKLLTASGDIVARVGGDEFTIIAPTGSGQERVETLCMRVVDAMRTPFEINGAHVFVGVSVGVACAPQDGQGRVELTRKADIALYEAKTTGRGRFAIFDERMDSAIQRRRTVERDLREALRTGEQLEAFFQPVYSAADRKLAGVEALMRWIHPASGFIPPDVFIPIAEETGLIEKVGEVVLRQACATAAALGIETVAVNVSAIELRNPGFASRVAATLMAAGLQPSRLELEVTESAIIDISGSTQENITALRELGIEISIDDFGTGFSSLGRLQNLAVDRIKIDRSFITGFGGSGSDEAIVKAIVDLAQAVGLKTTAEGVETPLQEQRLREMGCDHLQGYLLGKPMRSADLEALVGNMELAKANSA